MKTHRKTLIMLLVLCMVLAAFPVPALAEPAGAADTGIYPEAAEPAGAEERAEEAGGAKERPAEENTAEESSGESMDTAGDTAVQEQSAGADAAEKEKAEEGEAAAQAGEQAEKKSTALKAAVPVLKAADNSSVSYTAKRNPTSNDVQFTAKINGATYTGTCCELGVKFNSSGTAKIEALGKSHICRKIAYKYRSWQGDTKRNYDMGGVYRGGCLEAMMQYAMAWAKDNAAGNNTTANRDKVVAHMKKSSSSGGNGWSASTVNAIVAEVKAVAKKTPDELGIPGKFRVYWGKITNTKSGDKTYGQDALFWGDLVTGTGSVKKVPAAETADYVASHPDEFDLSGAKYQLYTDAACTVKASDAYWNNAVLTTKADGTSDVRTMEVGTYYAKETAAPKKGFGIAVNESTGKAMVYTVKITKDQRTTFTSEEPVRENPGPPDTPDISICKADAESDEPLAGAELAILDDSGTTVESWTSDTEPCIISGLDDGAYTLCEIKAPYGYETADDIPFAVEQGSVTVAGGGPEYGEVSITMKDPPVSLDTSAISASTGMQTGLISVEERITDTVSLTGLIEGRSYRLEGELIDKNSGEAIEGSSVEKNFIADNSTMEIPVDFTFDASLLEGGGSVVVYETLLRTTLLHGETAPAELGKHRDIDSAAQTVSYPSISTAASLQSSGAEVKDVIDYKNLDPDMEYVIIGWLVDTVSGEKVAGSDGRLEIGHPDDASGQAEMVLNAKKYDEMSGHSMTAFEELYVVYGEDGAEKEILIAEHKDLNDIAQTVEIYHDLKVRKNVTGNLGDLSKLFEYEAEFTGLVPGNAYKIEGDDEKTFMADAKGHAVVPIRLRDDQEAVIKQLPKGASYKVTEAASDHISGFSIFSEDMDSKGAKIKVRKASNGAEAAKLLSTAEETVDLLDGTVVVLWENNRDLATLTGLAGPDYRIYASVFGLLVLAFTMAILRILRRN